MFSRSKDMFGAHHAHQNLNGSRDFTTPLSRMFAVRGLALATINLSIKFDLSISTHYVDTKGDKMPKMGWFEAQTTPFSFGVVRGHSRSLEIAPLDSSHTSYY